MEEKEPIKLKLTTVLLIIAVIVIIVMGIFIYYLLSIKNSEDSIEINNLNNTKSQNAENTTEETKENNINEDSENVKNSTKNVSSSKLYDIKDAAKEYRLSENIKNYKDFNYDLDGDGNIDKITIQYDKELSKENGNDYYIFKLNGKQFTESEANPQIYIVDLNEDDKNIEVVIFDEGPSDDPNYTVFSKSENKMKDSISIPGLKFKLDKNGKFYVSNSLTTEISPEVYDKEYTINNGKVSFNDKYLNSIFNIDRPDDFKGHSLSISDVVVANGKPYYVDTFGFKELKEFGNYAEKERKKAEERSKRSAPKNTKR